MSEPLSEYGRYASSHSAQSFPCFRLPEDGMPGTADGLLHVIKQQNTILQKKIRKGVDSFFELVYYSNSALILQGGVTLNFDPMVPIWLQVATALKREIVTGKIPPGGKLPGGRDLAIRYEINPNTAARIYQELEREGVCQTRRGLGTFVTEDEASIASLRREMAEAALIRFTDELQGLGFSRQDGIRMLMEEEERQKC